MTEIRQLFLELAPEVFTNPLEATAGILVDVAAERSSRGSDPSPSACGSQSRLCFVSDDLRDRPGRRLAALSDEHLAALEDYAWALHERIAGLGSPGSTHA